jgi:hypothetical protein
VDNRWVIEKRREMWRVIIYSVVGLIIITGLVTLLNYASYANSSKRSDLPVAILARF